MEIVILSALLILFLVYIFPDKHFAQHHSTNNTDKYCPINCTYCQDEFDNGIVNLTPTQFQHYWYTRRDLVCNCFDCTNGEISTIQGEKRSTEEEVEPES